MFQFLMTDREYRTRRAMELLSPTAFAEPTSEPEGKPALLSEEDAAREAGVSPKTIRRHIQSGRLQAIDYGTGKRHNYRIKPEDLAELKPKAKPIKVEKIPTHRRSKRRAAYVASSLSMFPQVSRGATGIEKRPLTRA